MTSTQRILGFKLPEMSLECLLKDTPQIHPFQKTTAVQRHSCKLKDDDYYNFIFGQFQRYGL